VRPSKQPAPASKADPPHAIYALVQTVLVQDEALRLANARIEELQAQTSAPAEPEQRPASFLDSMREALGGRAPHPSVRTAAGNQPQAQQPQPGYPGAPGFGSGGSFLGTAASTAAGVIGGSLLLDGIRSMFGGHLGGARASAFARGDDPSATYADRANRIWRTIANKTPNKIWRTKTLNKTANKI